MTPDSERTIRIRVRGRVQGVFFRQSTADLAGRLGVRGWVTNRSDGTVEALLAGPEAAVGELVEWAHSGPDHASVESVETTDASGEEAPAGFEIR